MARARELLVRRNGIADEEAQRRLLRQAERSGRTLRSVAEAVLLAETVAPNA
ncbi:MAG: ANTAR domain-containing protein [Actinomycetota bacterium]